jgi:5-methylcytosine-specific restriction endonuclease McrA
MSRTHIPAELRRSVRQRAHDCCEYCLIPESMTLTVHEIDHIIAEKHGGPTEDGNLALAYALCNGFKGSDLASIDPESGSITPLFNPRRDRWTEHLRLENGRIEPLTGSGRATVRLLQLNHPHRVEERLLLVGAGMIRVPEAMAGHSWAQN